MALTEIFTEWIIGHVKDDLNKMQILSSNVYLPVSMKAVMLDALKNRKQSCCMTKKPVYDSLFVLKVSNCIFVKLMSSSLECRVEML